MGFLSMAGRREEAAPPSYPTGFLPAARARAIRARTAGQSQQEQPLMAAGRPVMRFQSVRIRLLASHLLRKAWMSRENLDRYDGTCYNTDNVMETIGTFSAVW